MLVRKAVALAILAGAFFDKSFLLVYNQTMETLTQNLSLLLGLLLLNRGGSFCF